MRAEEGYPQLNVKQETAKTPELYKRILQGTAIGHASEPTLARKTPEVLVLEEKIRKLESEIGEQLQRHRGTQSQLEVTKANRELLLKQQNLRHLLDRVCEPAQKELLSEGSLLASFDSAALEDAFVMSIDIRRSTELMLKAREPELFADFITALCIRLGGIIVDNLGVFDKFTGDGILAFFPHFFSGEDAGYRAVKAADECHEAFRSHYLANRRCFTAILNDTGLGIGIDYGKVRLVRVRGELTVVGTPVVYACRLGDAEAGQTLLNQPAYEQLFDTYGAYCRIDETRLHFKHEGEVTAYSVRLNEKARACKPPVWLKEALQDNVQTDEASSARTIVT